MQSPSAGTRQRSVGPERVEELFVRQAIVWEVVVGGRAIGTTAEHPFYVKQRGWTPAGELQSGDLLATADGRWTPVEACYNTGRFETVYNFRIADHHTYFVEGDEWGFAVWVHNRSCGGHSGILRKQMDPDGNIAKKGEAAAHLVPSSGWSRRKTSKIVADSQRIINEAGIGTDHAANGFFTTDSRHLGTHTNKFQVFLNNELRLAGRERTAIINTLRSISGQLQSGALKF